MKAVQVMFDEALLAKLDASEEVKQRGRSEVLRLATTEFLAKRREEQIDEAYRRAYAEHPVTEEEFPSWQDQTVWPE